MKISIFDKIKSKYFELLSINDSPEKIALGFAVGSFLGIFPTFGLGGVLALVFSWIFRLNYVSTILGAFIIMNPLTTPFFWAISAVVGGFMFSEETLLVYEAIQNKDFFLHISDMLLIYLVGNIIVAAVVSVVGYLTIKAVIKKRREKSPGSIKHV